MKGVTEEEIKSDEGQENVKFTFVHEIGLGFI